MAVPWSFRAACCIRTPIEACGQAYGGLIWQRQSKRREFQIHLLYMYRPRTIEARENRTSMSRIGLTTNVHAMDFIKEDAEASAPKRRCKNGSIQSDFELLSSGLAESECGIPDVKGSNMDLNDCENVDSSLEAGSSETATANDHCTKEPIRPLRVDPTSANPRLPPKRFPRAMWRGLVRRAVAHSIASHL
jgi:hypothetical protein